MGTEERIARDIANAFATVGPWHNWVDQITNYLCGMGYDIAEPSPNEHGDDWFIVAVDVAEQRFAVWMTAEQYPADDWRRYTVVESDIA